MSDNPISQHQKYGLDTLGLHAGYSPDPEHGSRAVPIYMTSAYQFNDSDHAAGLFDLALPGHIYSRLSNPTVAVLEERIAAMEGGTAAVATASGHAALFVAITTLMSMGGHVVASRALYGGSTNLFGNTLPRFGITTSFVDPDDPDAFERAITKDTRLIFTETIGNPGLEIADIEALSVIAKRHGLPLMVDATFASPALCKPIDWGADIILHSATKWLGGHGLAIGGLLVEAGTFNWMEHKAKYPTLTEPDTAYHGLCFAETFGPAAMSVRARAEGLRDFGAALSPMNAFLILQGIETLSLRMHQHTKNALAVAEWLEAQPQIAWVNYPGLATHKHYERAKRYFPNGAGSVVSFGIKGDREQAAKLIESVELFSHLANVGDAKSLLLHPASTTHRQLSDAQLKEAGIGADMIRLSIGLENIGDLTADLGQGLKRLAPK